MWLQLGHLLLKTKFRDTLLALRNLAEAIKHTKVEKKEKRWKKTLIKLRRLVINSNVENISFRRNTQQLLFFHSFWAIWQNLIKTSKISQSKPKFRFPGIFLNIPRNLFEQCPEYFGTFPEIMLK